MLNLAVAAALASPALELDFPGASEVLVRYEGKTILSGHVTGAGRRSLRKLIRVEQKVDPAVPMFLGYPHGPRTADWAPAGETKSTWSLVFLDDKLTFDGQAAPRGGRKACTTDAEAPLASSYGPANSGLNNAIYDRSDDWLIETRSKVSLSDGAYRFRSQAAPIVFKPNYYRDHLGYFLWDSRRPLWSRPVSGWCSWAAYGQGITQKEVVAAAQFFSKNLKAYGYQVIQIDDGYQRVLQITDNHQPITEPFSRYWTQPNKKFPDGMARLAQTISSLDMTPGIWVGLYLPLGLKHQEGYVKDADGKPLQGPWVGYSMSPDDPAAVAEAYTDTLATFRSQGWRYFKIDTLRHILYDSYRRVPGYWAERHTDSSDAYRKLFTAVRAAVGKDNYLLACWGALPELAGLPDGCRIGEDVGPSFLSMRKSARYIAQFHYANNVIWRNDPDYMCLRVPVDQCETWATLTSLTGEHVMVSDPVETYDGARVDILRRVGPPAVTTPLNLAPAKADPEWVTLTGAVGGENWTVAARFGWEAAGGMHKSLSDLGLDPEKSYIAFDFWKSELLGVVKGSADFHALDQGQCQVVAFRPLTGAPQVLGDDRHISQGANELSDVRWHGQTLSGQFRTSPGKRWSLFIYVPDGYQAELPANGALVDSHSLKLSFPDSDGWQEWKVNFRRS